MIIKCVIELIYMINGVDNVADNRLVSICCQTTLISLYIVSVLSVVHGCPFLLQPSSLNTSEGSIVNFTTIVCDTSISVFWTVNNLVYVQGYPSESISVHQSTLLNGSIQSDLIVIALLEYDNTVISSTVIGPQSMLSNVVYLKVQGIINIIFYNLN